MTLNFVSSHSQSQFVTHCSSWSNFWRKKWLIKTSNIDNSDSSYSMMNELSWPWISLKWIFLIFRNSITVSAHVISKFWNSMEETVSCLICSNLPVNLWYLLMQISFRKYCAHFLFSSSHLWRINSFIFYICFDFEIKNNFRNFSFEPSTFGCYWKNSKGNYLLTWGDSHKKYSTGEFQDRRNKKIISFI